ncbi:hypothetical protein BDQ17DRAFT_1276103 [Cyathus striatus]|nr:hypothetical protein BDQ17DRAFT_1276103 [Cyathus striatus]
MQSSSSLQDYPSTPAPPRTPLHIDPTYAPLKSSPLAPTTPSRTPLSVNNSQRRRAQYKAKLSTPLAPPSCDLFGVGSGEGGSSQKAFLREKFKKRCLAHAVKARERRIKDKRGTLASSDGFDMEEAMEDSEGDEDVMQDELFRRIMVNINQKQHCAYRVSYAREVGLSEPDIEGVHEWEQELRAQEEESQDLPPDLDDAELEVYAEEYAALADFEDIPDEELFDWADLENDIQSRKPVITCLSDMDTS